MRPDGDARVAGGLRFSCPDLWTEAVTFLAAGTGNFDLFLSGVDDVGDVESTMVRRRADAVDDR